MRSFFEGHFNPPRIAKKMKCLYCLVTIDGKFEVISTPCGHVFHEKCLKTWMKSSRNSCPQCCQPFSYDDIRLILVPLDNQKISLVDQTRMVKRIRNINIDINQSFFKGDIVQVTF